MRVIVLNDFRAESGGGSAIAWFCARQIAKHGLEVVFVSGDGPREPCLHEHGLREIGLGLSDVRSLGAVQGALTGLWREETRRRLGPILADARSSTVVLLHQYTRVLSPAVFAALHEVPTLFFAHDYFLRCPNGAYYHFGKQKLCTVSPGGLACALSPCDRESSVHKGVRFVRNTIQSGDLQKCRRLTVVCVSDGQRDRYGPMLAGQGLDVCTLANIPVQAPEPLPPDDRAPNGIAFVGRIVEEKGCALLLAAGRRLGIPVEIFGDGPERPRLMGEYPEAVWHGWLPRSELQQRLQGFAALAVPSLWAETSALVALEALDLGVPVVASDRICIAPWIHANGLGLSVDVASKEVLDAALQQVCGASWADGPLRTARARAAEIDFAAREQTYGDKLLTLVTNRLAAETELSR